MLIDIASFTNENIATTVEMLEMELDMIGICCQPGSEAEVQKRQALTILREEYKRRTGEELPVWGEE